MDPEIIYMLIVVVAIILLTETNWFQSLKFVWQVFISLIGFVVALKFFLSIWRGK